MTTQTDNRLALTDVDAATIYFALHHAERVAQVSATEFMRKGDIEAAGCAFQAAAEAVELRNLYDPIGEDVKHIGNNAGQLTVLLSALIAFRASGLRFLAKAPEEVAAITRERLADVQSLINRVAAFLRSNDPAYCAAFAEQYMAMRESLPGWSTGAPEDRVTFDELVSLISGEPVPGSYTKQ